jgi:malate/lactate dehydrogenase
MCLAAIIASDGRQMHGQVSLEEEVYGLRGVCGVPITLNSDGWRVLAMNNIEDTEQKMLHQAAESITSFNDSVLATPAPGHDVS